MAKGKASTKGQVSPLSGSHRVTPPGGRYVMRADGHSLVEICISVRRKRALPDRTPTLSLRALTRDYGARRKDIALVESEMQAAGLRHLWSCPASRLIRFEGRIAQLEEIFGVDLKIFELDGRHIRARTGMIHVPATLDGIVEDVLGLDLRPIGRIGRAPRPVPSLVAGAGSAPAFSNTIATRYNFPSGDGAGQRIGVIELDGTFLQSDIQAYCAIGGTPCVPQVVAVPGLPPVPPGQPDRSMVEVAMDLQIIAGICPAATLIAYFGAGSHADALADALRRVLTDQQNFPSVLSISWGDSEQSGWWASTNIVTIDQLLGNLRAMGVTICVATGDDGSRWYSHTGDAEVCFPASSTNVLAVGGTTIPANGPDIVWNGRSGASGGGVSACIAMPAWQSAVALNSANRNGFAGRCIPDISANADPDVSPYLVVVENGHYPQGGTSASAPLVAALVALINADRATLGKGPIGHLTPLLYEATGNGDGRALGVSCCTDVMSGNNQVGNVPAYGAGGGYDCASGWGTPDGMALLASLRNRP